MTKSVYRDDKQKNKTKEVMKLFDNVIILKYYKF